VNGRDLRAVVVGHVEWVHFVRVESLPNAGEIAHAVESWEEPAGGGPAAAVQLSKLAGSARLLTALGDDEIGQTAAARLSDMGLDIHYATRGDAVTRRAVTFVDSRGERTITVIGSRLDPRGSDEELPWKVLDETDGCYFTAGDLEALRAARRSRVLVATSRVKGLLQKANVRLDALVGSAVDPSETYRTGDLNPVPGLAVLTDGERGGSYSVGGGDWISYEAPPLRGPVVDRYGAGDSFAAGLTFGLAAGLEPGAAVGLAARCGAAVLGGRGPYERQLTYPEIAEAVAKPAAPL
jgi:ribokinase